MIEDALKFSQTMRIVQPTSARSVFQASLSAFRTERLDALDLHTAESAGVQPLLLPLEFRWGASGSEVEALRHERLTLRQRVELTNRCIGVVEDTYALELTVNAGKRLTSMATALLGVYDNEDEAAREGSSGTRQHQLVCRQRICVGPAVVATTLRTYRFDSEIDDEPDGEESHGQPGESLADSLEGGGVAIVVNELQTHLV
jgi:hypothetical protein